MFDDDMIDIVTPFSDPPVCETCREALKDLETLAKIGYQNVSNLRLTVKRH